MWAEQDGYVLENDEYLLRVNKGKRMSQACFINAADYFLLPQNVETVWFIH